ncbi:hypothetical protein CANARDRAFT_24269 [[Candida] arabinofermentans NRRL YB-2248]|uniref:Uncharacterized protein n=1 Tax=[Candida] arabinofermentans NRRL YB-2248 TaxID=983967 RepID=A0A1E4SXG3_9ASCO|nr:hypothetical protein CANARDRAFT_24269 [[Candida] arabinofermentans NRRL YB-2248]
MTAIGIIIGTVIPIIAILLFIAYLTISLAIKRKNRMAAMAKSTDHEMLDVHNSNETVANDPNYRHTRDRQHANDNDDDDYGADVETLPVYPNEPLPTYPPPIYTNDQTGVV